MGRRDGKISRTSEALANIPPPFSNITSLLAFFSRQGLDLKDLTLLSAKFDLCYNFLSEIFQVLTLLVLLIVHRSLLACSTSLE